MEHWEFLIQKQGDRSWLPLESPDVEILEGRYRVVVRSSRPDTDVEVCVVHQSSGEVPPKRKIQRRSRRTNSEGLIVVIPYTYLKPGTWELHCGSLMSALDQNWQYAVHLQVLSQEASLGVGLDPDEILEVTEMPTPSPVFTETIGEIGGEKSISDEILSPDLLPIQSSTEITSSRGLVPTLAIALTETTYIAQGGQSLTISGQIEATTQTSHDPAAQELTAAGELRICLCNPERGQIISEIRQQSINLQVLPSPFSCIIEIPADCETQLILGQVNLYGNRHEDDLASAPDQEPVLATQPFTITAGLEGLLGVIASDQIQADTLQPTPASPDQKQLETASIPLNLALLELVKTPKTRQVVRFQPVANQPLPPLIDPPKPAKLRPEPALPKFPRQSAEVVQPGQMEEAAPPDVVPDVSSNAPSNASLDLAALEAATVMPGPSDEEDRSGDDALEVPPNLLSSVDAAFQELKLQYRFWTRLNALAADAEFSEPLGIEESFTSNDADGGLDSTQIEAATAIAQPHPWPDADGLAQEIVVDDEVPQTPSPLAIGVRPQPDRAVSRLSVSLPKTSNQVVMPIPELEIQRGELTAGQTIRVRVQLPPPHGVQIAVKLWVQDCQTRLLLDDPRWIDDLAPDGLGNLEATFDLTVPLGSLEVRFEAIAVDGLTQQESHKASIDRTVIPPDLPVLQPLEDALLWTP